MYLYTYISVNRGAAGADGVRAGEQAPEGEERDDDPAHQADLRDEDETRQDFLCKICAGSLFFQNVTIGAPWGGLDFVVRTTKATTFFGRRPNMVIS